MSAPRQPSRLAVALRLTAERIAAGAPYQWGHMGQCNCGHLAQTVTQRSAAQIHRSAIDANTGEWSEHLNDYCGATGALIDDVTRALLDFGFGARELQHLEYLSDHGVLARLGVSSLVRSEREDAVRYLRAWADLVDEATLVPAR